jgi:hypothetical protein
VSDNDWLPLRRLLKQLGQPHDDRSTNNARDKIRRLERKTGRKLLSGKPLGCRATELQEVWPELFIDVCGQIEKRVMSKVYAALKTIKHN